jgi:hypothetical protein
MPDQLSSRVQDCYRRADDCARRAEAADCAEQRKFWDEQEARWIQIAGYSQFSERVASFLRSGRPEPNAILREEAAGLDALVDIFSRVCAAMDIDTHDESALHAIAHALVRAAKHGIRDAEVFYNLAVHAVSR